MLKITKLILIIGLLALAGQAGASTLYENSSSDTTGTAIGDSFVWVAQTFTADSYHTLTSVQFRGSKTNHPGDLTVSIRETTDGLPSGSDLTSVTIAESALPLVSASINAEMSTPINLTAGKMYAIVFRVPAAGGSNLFSVRSGSGYSGGSRHQSNDSGATWSAQTGDYVFYVYGDPLLLSATAMQIGMAF